MGRGASYSCCWADCAGRRSPYRACLLRGRCPCDCAVRLVLAWARCRWSPPFCRSRSWRGSPARRADAGSLGGRRRRAAGAVVVRVTGGMAGGGRSGVYLQDDRGRRRVGCPWCGREEAGAGPRAAMRVYVYQRQGRSSARASYGNWSSPRRLRQPQGTTREGPELAGYGLG